MLDIVQVQDGTDLGFADTAVVRAGSVIGVQIGELEYAADFGSDLAYFLAQPLQFQNASFRAYLVERLAYHQINVSDILAHMEPLFERFEFFVGDANTNMQGMIR